MNRLLRYIIILQIFCFLVYPAFSIEKGYELTPSVEQTSSTITEYNVKEVTQYYDWVEQDDGTKVWTKVDSPSDTSKTVTTKEAQTQYYDLTKTGVNHGYLYNNSENTNPLEAHFIDNTKDDNGGAIYNKSSMGDISGDFLGNSIVNHDSSIRGGALYNYTSGTIQDITGDFINNYVSSQQDGDAGAIYNRGSINSIVGNFIQNYVIADEAKGGAYYSSGNASVNLIEGNFYDNYVKAEGPSGEAYGGAIFNQSNIGKLKGDFIGNKSESLLYKSRGGAIHNFTGTIDEIEGNFINNKTVSGSDADGGAIFNENIIGSIKGDFVGNTVEAPEAKGGAVFNRGEIKNGITGTFQDNKIVSEDTNGKNALASGAAIMNEEQITGGIRGDFVNNGIYIKTENYNAESSGGAIINYTGASIDFIDGDFLGNSINIIVDNAASASVLGGRGGALVNYGSITNITGDFISNGIKSEGYGAYYSYGGAFVNEHNTKIDLITGNFIGNYLSSKSTANLNGKTLTSYGGALFNNDSAIINLLEGNFLSNTINAESIDRDIYVSGGAVVNIDSQIGTIKGIFEQNSLNANSGNADISAKGGAISNEGTIDLIDGQFNSNKINASTSNNYLNARGAAVYNKEIIKEIKANFTNNSITSDIPNYTENVSLQGGALNNTGTINSMKGDFSNNFLQADINTSDYTEYLGGALFNNNQALIGTLNSSFIQNYIKAESNDAVLYGFGGAIYNRNSEITDLQGDFIKNSITLSSNQNESKARGGAIYSDEKINSITGNFIGNYVSGTSQDSVGEAIGGAVYNSGDIISITGDFVKNYAKAFSLNDETDIKGGAIYNSGTINTLKSSFSENAILTDSQNNSSDVKGAAVYNRGTINLIEGDFKKNIIDIAANKKEMDAYGAALCNRDTGIIDKIKGSFFNNKITASANSSDTKIDSEISGGALYSSGNIKEIEGNFINNEINVSGNASSFIKGAGVANYGEMTSVKGDFYNNIVNNPSGKTYASAFYNDGAAKIQEINGNFYNNKINSLSGRGGAVSNNGKIGVLSGVFQENKITTTKGNALGGAVFNHSGASLGEIKNSSFINNSAVSESNSAAYYAKGGAVYSESDLKITADNAVSLFQGNSAVTAGSKEDNAVYLAQDISSFNTVSPLKLSLNALNDGVIRFDDKISGGAIDAEGKYIESSQYTFDLDIDGDSSGSIIINNEINNAKLSLKNTNLDVMQDKYLSGVPDLSIHSGIMTLHNLSNNNLHFNNLKLDGTLNINNVEADLKNQTMGRITSDNYLSALGSINVNNITLLSDAVKDETKITFADSQIAQNVSYKGPSPIAYTPVYKYDVSYLPDEGKFLFLRGNTGGDSNPSDGFNPSILSSPVAMQTSAYTTQLQSFNYAFHHSDVFMNMPYSQRIGIENANKYALKGSVNKSDIDINAPLYTDSIVGRGVWMRPYSSFESVPLKNGPKVSNINYGTLIGFDTDIESLKFGMKGVFTGYAGYNGASQRYSGIDSTQNGGILGATWTMYKKNFFSALTLNSGASVGDSSGMYGQDDYVLFMAGLANKMGYNFEFGDGNLILQPSLQTSYSFVNTFDYTNAAGVRINSDPLHAIQLSPGIKLIGNTKNGWSPYLTVNMVWNIMDKSKVSADDIILPQMSIKPYIEYGAGIQKRWHEKFSAYFQTVIRNGGRNGVALSFGFKWSI